MTPTPRPASPAAEGTGRPLSVRAAKRAGQRKYGRVARNRDRRDAVSGMAAHALRGDHRAGKKAGGQVNAPATPAAQAAAAQP